MNIRRMTVEDHASVEALWREAGLSEEPEDGAGDIAAFLGAPQCAAFVAEEAGELRGAVLCGSDGRYGYIHHLAVRKGLRKTGIGRALTKACIGFLKTRHIIIMVRDSNKEGLGFWRRMGFARVDGIGVQYVAGRGDKG